MGKSADQGGFASMIARRVADGTLLRRRRPTTDHHARWLGKLHSYGALHSGGVFNATEIADMLTTLHAAGIETPPYHEPGAASLTKMVSLATLE